jgi:hypothetical protein
MELCQVESQQRETLTKVIVKFSGDPGALLLLRLNHTTCPRRSSPYPGSTLGLIGEK